MENSNSRDGLSPLEKKHISFMREIAESLSNSPTILKGGTALLLSYGLDRYSEDLDFDSTKALNLEKRISDAAKKQKINILSIKLKKDTSTTKRYVVEYESEKGKNRLKIETSFRTSKISADNITLIDGIKTYKIEGLIRQKFDAIQGRTKVRDLYDITYLSGQFGALFNPQQVKKLEELTNNPNSLISRFQSDAQTDYILKNNSLDKIVLELQKTAEILAGGQQALLESASLEQSYQETLSMYVQAAHDQVEHIEERLDAIIERQQSRLQQTQNQQPGFLALPSSRKSWETNQSRQQDRLQTLYSRLELVREIKEGMGLHSSRIEELATRKMRIKNPELAASLDSMKEAKRRQELNKKKEQKRQQTHKKTKGRSLYLNDDG